MIDQREQAERIQATMNTPGWSDIASIFKEHIDGPKEEVFAMFSRPETLTGKAAYIRAGRSKGCSDLLEDIQGKLQILVPNPRQGGA